MGTPYKDAISRRGILAAGLALVARPAFASRGFVVTLLGDSITAGYGLSAADALPVRLQAALASRGISATVRGAGVSGDTTAGGLARVGFSVQPDTDLCIVELGGNDLLQGLDPKSTRANLDQIVRRLKARRIGVLVTGITAPPAIGRAYAAEFDATFAAVARAQGVPLYPDLLAGITGNALFRQHDGIHPNAAGVQVIARNLAPVVVRALRGRG